MIEHDRCKNVSLCNLLSCFVFELKVLSTPTPIYSGTDLFGTIWNRINDGCKTTMDRQVTDAICL